MGADTTKTRILEAAGPIFAQKGFAATTVREICSAANVNQAAINYYYTSKENLYREIFRSVAPLDMSIIPDDVEASFEERLLHFMKYRANIVLANPCVAQWRVQLVLREFNDPTPGMDELLKEMFSNDCRKIRDFLLKHLKKDEISDDIPWKLTFFLVGCLSHYHFANHVLSELVSADDWEKHFNPEQIAIFISKLFLKATEDLRTEDKAVKIP